MPVEVNTIKAESQVTKKEKAKKATLHPKFLSDRRPSHTVTKSTLIVSHQL